MIPVLSLLVCMLSPAFAKPVRENPVPEEILLATSITWLGLDYSRVRMVGVDDFRDPAAIFPDHLHGWNAMFVEESLDSLRRAMRRQVSVDLTCVNARNEATAANVQRLPGDEVMAAHPRLERFDLEEFARAYGGQGRGVGLLFVMEDLLKQAEQACLYPTFVDLTDGRLLWTQRTCGWAQGMTFRQHWFHPFVDAILDLRYAVRRS